MRARAVSFTRARELYKSVGCEAHVLPQGALRVVSPVSGETFVVPATLMSLIQNCRSFRTLDDHARDAARSASGGRAARRGLSDAVHWLANSGFLLSESQLLAALGASPYPSVPGRIAIIGIPTADRPRLLARALRSYIRCLDHHGRDPLFLVIDDSRAPENQAANRAIVAALARQDRDALYVGQGERRRMLRLLTARTGIDRRQVEFAALSDTRYPVTTGAARNALLLLSAGRRLLHVDDDTLAQTAVMNPRMRDRLRLSPHTHLTARFDTWPRLQNVVADESRIDILAAHERLLGRTVGDCLADRWHVAPCFDDVDHTLLAAVRRGPVAMTATGVIGDPGTQSSTPLLVDVADRHLEPLLRSPSVYRSTVVARRLLWAAEGHTLLVTRRCFAMNIGLDVTRPLPPFMPMLRGSDGVFGTLLQLGHGLVGVLPFAILHLPPGRRRALPDRKRNPLFQANLHLIRLLMTVPEVPEGPLGSVWPAIGASLQELATHDQEAFDARLLSLARRVAAAKLRRIEALAVNSAGHSAGPLYRRHLNLVGRHMHDALAQDQLRASDIEEVDVSAPATQLRELIHCFGGLLKVWADLVGAAAGMDLVEELRRPGKR